MKSKIKTETLGIIIIAIILVIFGIDHRDRAEKYHREMYELMAEHYAHNEFHLAMENGLKIWAGLSEMGEQKVSVIRFNGEQVRKVGMDYIERSAPMAPPTFGKINPERLAILFGNNEQSKNTGNREENN